MNITYDTVLLIKKYGCNSCTKLYGSSTSNTVSIIPKRDKTAVWYILENDIDIWKAGIVLKHTEFGNTVYQKEDLNYTIVPPMYWHLDIKFVPTILYLKAGDIHNYIKYEQDIFDVVALKQWMLDIRKV